MKQARVFLRMLDPGRAEWDFRTFDDVSHPDGSKRGDKRLTKTFRGTLDEHASALQHLNAQGAGVYVTVNQTDGKGRKTENVTEIVAVFADTDGAPLEPLLALKPHICLQSSPGKYHAYWRVSDCPLDQFKPVQQAIAKKFHTDRNVCDAGRVMRLPGFHHNKHEPTLVTFVPAHMDARNKPYTLAEVIKGLGLMLEAPGSRPAPALIEGLGANLGSNTDLKGGAPPPPVETMRAMLTHLAEREYFKYRSGVEKDEAGRIIGLGWLGTGMALKLAYGDEMGLDLWAITHEDDNARSDAPAQWKSFASEYRPGHLTLGTIIRAAEHAGFPTCPVQMVTPDGEEPFTDNSGDVKNGKLFAQMFRNKLLHVYETGDWLSFDPLQGWVKAPPHEADRAAKEVLHRLRAKAADCWKTTPHDPETKRLMAHVERTSQLPRLRAMVEMAKSEDGMTVRLNEFDADPMLLGVANGVLDLRTGELMPVSPEVLVSKRANVAFDPAADCQRFKQFICEVQPGNEMRAFLRRFVGYCLTGQVGEHTFLFLYGLGANGKSVFVEIIAWLLGDYAQKIATEMLMQHQRNPQGPSPDIVALKGSRLIYANETEEGQRLANARVKDLTGGDTLTGRVPYGVAAITFDPTHKLVVVGNHKPEITDNSDGMWRRVALTPFEQTISEAKRDPKLLEALKSEAPGILNWALAGLRDWRANGLQIPQSIKAATAAYRDEQDIIGDWIGERCNAGAGCSAKKSMLYDDYQQWARQNGHGVLAQGRLTKRLNERGFRLAADKRTVHGLTLKTSTGFGRNL